MTGQNWFPQYVPRSEEQRLIEEEAKSVRTSGKSRAILLYGRGGVGKTCLVRQLAELEQDPDAKIAWLDPIDVDDSQHWLLSNLEQHVADQLDPGRDYFGPYYQYVSELPRQRLLPANRETVVDHLNRIKEVFTQCYKQYVDATGNSVVITFDTVEAIRGMYFLRTLTRWMKALPRTLFILAGRSLPEADDWLDPIRTALADPPGKMDVTVIPLGEFEAADSRIYLSRIRKDTDLTDEEAEKLICLTQGHPLWLAFTVDYLTANDLPEETQAPLDEIEADLPYHADASAAGEELAESFKRRLVAPYREGDFWHEALKRLAVVRESVSQPVWESLMADRQLPAGVADYDQAWKQLQATEWIRLRANRRYVTLHDAVAEELAQRVISIHDIDHRMRRELWAKAAGIYAGQAAVLEEQLAERKAVADSELDAIATAEDGPGGAASSRDEAALMREIAELDQWQQELNQLRAVQLFYELLSDFRQGTRLFIELAERAKQDHDVLLEDLLAFQMQRFLPGAAEQSTLSDTVGAEIGRFREWLTGDGWNSYVNIGLKVGDYLIDREQPLTAARLLDKLPVPPDHKRRYLLRSQQGNACMRIPGRAREAGLRFQEALAEASKLPLAEQYRFVSDAYKELGFYYRNIGHWQFADETYGKARDSILHAPRSASPEADREEMASIYTNWAYVKGVGGKYDDAINMVESAITVRRRMGKRREHAISCSVKGEVYRYHRQFKEAWEVYGEALQLFGESSLSWLGVLYQEQAICLFQSIPAAVQLVDPPQSAADKAEELILDSLELCRVHNVRYYPSALNRAGRIFGAKDPELGLSYLAEGAERAREISDGWFWIANLIEYAELCYRAWDEGKHPEYLDLIPPIAAKLDAEDATELEFPLGRTVLAM
jgi:tetratricopeptide (TPR) repeat protein